MSKPNKVNKGNYVQGGRLTPDEMARERVKQSQVPGHTGDREKITGQEQQERAARESTRRQSESEGSE